MSRKKSSSARRREANDHPHLRLVPPAATPPTDEPVEKRVTRVPRPAWARRGETIHSLRVTTDRNAGAGLLPGDEVLVSAETRPRNGDLAFARLNDSNELGVFRHAPGGYFTLTGSDDGEVSVYEPAGGLFVGRVMEVRRGGRTVLAFDEQPDSAPTAGESGRDVGLVRMAIRALGARGVEAVINRVELGADLQETQSLVERLGGLRGQLDRLERLPENEAARFELEKEIERVTRELETDTNDWAGFDLLEA